MCTRVSAPQFPKTARATRAIHPFEVCRHPLDRGTVVTPSQFIGKISRLLPSKLPPSISHRPPSVGPAEAVPNYASGNPSSLCVFSLPLAWILSLTLCLLCRRLSLLVWGLEHKVTS